MSENKSEGYVVKLVTDDELIFNLGADDGVEIDQLYQVLDPNTRDIIDPVTTKSLGSIDRVLAQVVVTTVQPKISLARVHPSRGSGLTTLSSYLAGTSPSIHLSPTRWPEGVEVTHPVRYTGKKIVRRPSSTQ